MTGRAKRVIPEATGGGPTVSGGYVGALLRFAGTLGCDRLALLRQAGLSLEDLDDRDRRIPLAQCATLMAAAETASGLSAFALRFGEALGMDDVSVALLAAGGAATVAEAGVRFNRFGPLALDGAVGGDMIRLRRDGHGAWIEVLPGSGPGLRPFVEAGLVWCVRQIRALAGQAGAVRTVHLRREAPPDPAEYLRVFGAPVVFGAACDAIQLAGDFLAAALPPGHPYVSQLIEDRAEALLGDLEASRSVRGRVEGRLAERLPRGRADMALIAQDLGMSLQTLRRRLAAEGCGFEQVLDELRRRRALDLLAQAVAVKEVSARLGFSEPAAFSRAFKRWTGVSPSAARRA
jgi:AraC-like DNA-binding protein